MADRSLVSIHGMPALKKRGEGFGMCPEGDVAGMVKAPDTTAEQAGPKPREHT